MKNNITLIKDINQSNQHNLTYFKKRALLILIIRLQDFNICIQGMLNKCGSKSKLDINDKVISANQDDRFRSNPSLNFHESKNPYIRDR